MDERSLQGLISSLIPDEIEGFLTQSGEQPSRSVELLKTAAGQVGGEADVEINNFLNGRGALLETTRAAATRSGVSASNTVAEFLTGQLHFSPALARIVAPLLVNLLPGIGKLPGSGAAAKPKPKRKKPKSSSTQTAHQAKPKKPKSATSSKPKKPKTSSSKKPAAKPKRRGRAGEIPAGAAQE